MSYNLIVKRSASGRQWDIVDTVSGDIVEGGFFSKARAEEAKETWKRELLDEEIRRAERRAGWDPNP